MSGYLITYEFIIQVPMQKNIQQPTLSLYWLFMHFTGKAIVFRIVCLGYALEMPELKIIGSIIHASQELCFCLRNEKYGSPKSMFKKQLFTSLHFSSYKTHIFLV